MFSKLSKVEQEITAGLIYLAVYGTEEDFVKMAQIQPSPDAKPAADPNRIGAIIKDTVARLSGVLQQVKQNLIGHFNKAKKNFNAPLTNPADIAQSIKDILAGKGGDAIRPELINRELAQVSQIVQSAVKKAQESGIDPNTILNQVREIVSRFVPGAQVDNSGKVRISSNLKRIKIALVQEMTEAAAELDELGMYDQANVLDDIMQKLSE